MLGTPQLRAALREHRVSRRLSYPALVADIEAVLGADKKLSMFTVRAFIEGTTAPYETTERIVAEYLKAHGVEVAA